MTGGISIIFPHADNPENNACLELKKRMLRENTVLPYQLLYVSGTTPDDVYPAWNWLASIAKYDIILWDNSDIVYCYEWDTAVYEGLDGDAINWLGIRLVEPGAIGVAPTNIHRDFGRTAATFDREGFERFAEEEAKRHPSPEWDAFAWFSPSCFKKQWFLDMGGFPTEKPFPHPNDSIFLERVKARGCRFGVANSYAYHFQRAGENLGTKPERS